MGLYDQFKKAFEDIVAPEIHALRGEIQRVDGRVDGKIGGGARRDDVPPKKRAL